MSDRHKAARKAARTRAVNRAMTKRYLEVDIPTMRRMDVLLNSLLPHVQDVKLRWNPLVDTGRKLKHGVEYGTLLKFKNGGRILQVLPDGYKRPIDFHPAFWEPLV